MTSPASVNASSIPAQRSALPVARPATHLARPLPFALLVGALLADTTFAASLDED